MKPYSDGNNRHYVCKKCGKQISEPLPIWKRKFPEWKNVCLDCLPNRKQCIRKKSWSSWCKSISLTPDVDERETLSYD